LAPYSVFLRQEASFAHIRVSRHFQRPAINHVLLHLLNERSNLVSMLLLLRSY